MRVRIQLTLVPTAVAKSEFNNGKQERVEIAQQVLCGLLLALVTLCSCEHLFSVEQLFLELSRGRINDRCCIVVVAVVDFTKTNTNN